MNTYIDYARDWGTIRKLGHMDSDFLSQKTALLRQHAQHQAECYRKALAACGVDDPITAIPRCARILGTGAGLTAGALVTPEEREHVTETLVLDNVPIAVSLVIYDTTGGIRYEYRHIAPEAQTDD